MINNPWGVSKTVVIFSRLSWVLASCKFRQIFDSSILLKCFKTHQSPRNSQLRSQEVLHFLKSEGTVINSKSKS